jgi:hypothetical protein
MTAYPTKIEIHVCRSLISSDMISGYILRKFSYAPKSSESCNKGPVFMC